MQTYEIEIKSLLGSGENADNLRAKMAEIDPGVRRVAENTQLNHYFIGGDMSELCGHIFPCIPQEEAREKLTTIVENGKDFSVRTREIDGKTVLLVIKASVDDTTSANGISRLEFEHEMPEMTLANLDALLLDAGFSYQSKWSREREEYICRGTNICFDRNAGYGYVAEFEKIVDNESDATRARNELRELMSELGAEELPQDRLERMFAHYNANWPEYYGTDKVFVIE